MIRIVSIGECMAEMLQEADGRYRRGFAGDTFNMAWYASRIGRPLGIAVDYATVVGEDKFGREMLAAWAADGIGTDLVMTTPAKNTGLYFADTDAQGNRDYTFYRADSAARQFFQHPRHAEVLDKALQADAIYLSAITLMILRDDERQKMVDFIARARQQGVTTIFDTNYRPSGWTSPAEAARWMTAIFPHISIALPTQDENHTVFGDADGTATARRIKEAGAGEVACKCGPADCMIADGSGLIAVPALPGIRAVDTTSAGDSFNAAYVCARLSGYSPADSARWGHHLAAIVVQHRGALIPPTAIPAFPPVAAA